MYRYRYQKNIYKYGLAFGLVFLVSTFLYSPLAQPLQFTVPFTSVVVPPEIETAHAASVNIQITASADDGEQNSITSNDLEFVQNNVGVRFPNVTIPQGATINSATIQFSSERASQTGTSEVTILGDDTDNASQFTVGTDIADRTKTTASVVWNIPNWNTDNEQASAQLTPDLTDIVQEIVDRGGWSSGNAMAFLTVGGTGATRRANSVDETDASAEAAVLDIDYTVGGGGSSGNTPGDYMVRRNDNETDSITTSNLDSTWDTLVASNGSSITYSAGTYTLASGKYLVMYSERFDSTSTADNERMEVQGRLVINGTATTTGAGQSFLRGNSGQNESVVSGSAILDIASDSTDLDVRFYRTDNETVPTLSRVPDWGGVTIVALDDTWDYARYNLSVDTATVDTFGEVVWDATAEEDTGFSRTGANITITDAGQYLVAMTIPIQTNSGTDRTEYISKLQLDNVDVDGSYVSTYMRQNESTDDGVLSYVGIIDVAASDVLDVKLDATDGAIGSDNMLAGSSIEIVQLPAAAETIIVEAVNGDMVPATVTEFAWDSTPQIDSGTFTHTSPTDSFFEVEVADDYLFFGSMWTTDGGTRTFSSGRFSVNDTIQTHAAGGQYNRSSTADDAGFAFGGLVTGLLANDQISLEVLDISGGGSGTQNCTSCAMSGVSLSSLFPDTGPTEWNATDWTLYDEIIIDSSQIDADLNDFPVYVDLADLSSTFWSTTPAASTTVGTDIRVVNATGTAFELPRELVAASSTAQTGELHFKANFISSSADTTFRIYYNGNTDGDYDRTATYGSENVWTNDYVLVYHLEEDGNSTAGGYLDSTSFQAHGTGTSMTAASDVAGQLGKSQTFDGTSDFIDTSSTYIANQDQFSASVWFNSDTGGASTQRNILGQGDSAGDCGGSQDEWQFTVGDCSDVGAPNQLQIKFETGSDDVNAEYAVDVSDTWTLMHGNHSDLNGTAEAEMFVNGVSVASDASTLAVDYTNFNSPLRIGGPGNGTRLHDGEIDEVRIASTTRSAAWIKAVYENQSVTSGFYTASSSSGGSGGGGGGGGGQGAFDLGWSLYDQITIPSSEVDKDLTDFPVYIDLADLSSRFWSTTPSSTSLVGTDIRVTTEGNVELARELVAASSTAQTGELHFKATSLSSSADNVFKIWYNGTTTGDYAVTDIYGAQNVWTNDYMGVWHLGEGDSTDSGFYKDSTSNGRDGTLVDSDSDTVASTSARIGGAVDFAGDNDEITTGTFTPPTDTTVSFWLDPDDSDFSRLIGVTNDWEMTRLSPSGNVRSELYESAGGVNGPTAAVSSGGWYYVAATSSGSTGNTAVAVNGTLGTVGSNDQTTPTAGVFNIAGRDGQVEHFDGTMDEVRVASTTRSGGWITTEYANQNDPSSFYSVTTGREVAITGALYANDGSTAITESKTIVAAIGTSTPSLYSTTTASDGSYEITGIEVGSIGTWASTTAANEAVSWDEVTYGNGRFVAVASTNGDNTFMYSDDGSAWTSVSPSEFNDWRTVTYGNGLFVALSSDGTNRVRYSDDGIVWSEASAAEANVWLDVTYGNGRFVAVASVGTNRVMYSDDGINWSSAAAPEANVWGSVAYGNGRYVAVAQNGTSRVMYSDDGVSWNLASSTENNIWSDITYGNGRFVAVSLDGTNRVMYSDDGVSWTPASATEANTWSAVTYGNGRFVAVSNSGTNRVMYSDDGINWSSDSAASQIAWVSVTYGKGRYVAVANVSVGRVMYADAGFGEDTPITIFVDENATTSSSTATTLTFGLNEDASVTSINADLIADTVLLQKTAVGNAANEIHFDDRAFYDSYDEQLADPDSNDILFTATTSTTTVDADLQIASGTTVFAPQNLVLDGDFRNYGTFYAERGEVVAEAQWGDVSSARYIAKTPDILTSTIRGGAVSASGDKLYTLDGSNGTLEQFTLTVPFAVTTAVSDTSTSTLNQDSSMSDLFFKPDGTSFYTTGDQNDQVYQYDLTTPWDVSTAAYIAATTTSAAGTVAQAIVFKPDGTKMYIGGTSVGNDIHEYNLTTAWDITTASYLQADSDGNNITGATRALAINFDGTEIFTKNNGNNTRQFTFGTPWDITTLTEVTTLDLAVESDDLIDYHYFSADGSRFYTGGPTDFVYQFDLDDTQHFTGNFSATSSLYDLTIGGTATVSPAATTEIDGDYHVGGSAAGPYAGLVELTSTSTLSGTGNFGFVEVQGTASSTATEMTFSDLTVVSGGDFTAPVYGTLNITGDFDTSAGTFDIATATTYFGGQGTYNVQSISYVTATSVAAQTTSPEDIHISPDGSKMYIVVTGEVLEYTLTTPGDVSTALYIQSTSTSGVLNGVTFSSDGSFMYTAGLSSISADQYYLSTPWDVSTAAFLYATSTIANAASMTISPDGTYMYITNSSGGQEYSRFTLTTPWDVRTATEQQNEAGDNQSTNPDGINFAPDGKTFVTSDDNIGGDIFFYQTATPWDITSFSFLGSFDTSGQDASPEGVVFSGDGTSIYIVGNDTDTVYQYDIAAAIGTSTATNALENVFFNASGTSVFTGPASTTDFTVGSNATVTASAAGLTIDGTLRNNSVFNSNGGTTYFGGDGRFDSMALRYKNQLDVSVQTTSPQDAAYSADGTKLFVADSNADSILEYTLATAFDLSTASYSQASTSIGVLNPRSIRFKPDGTQLIIGDDQGDAVYGYTLSTPWDISTLEGSPVSTSTTAYETTLTGVYVSPDGTRLFTVGLEGDDFVNELTLMTPWDVSTAAYVAQYEFADADTPGGGIYFSADGTRFFSQDTINNNVLFEYSLSTPWDLSTATQVHESETAQRTSGTTISGIGFSETGADFVATHNDFDLLYGFDVLASHADVSGSNALGDVVVGGASTFAGTASTSDLTIFATGELTLPTTTVSVAGSYTNNGSFIGQYGELQLTGAGQTIAGDLVGNNALHNVTVTGSYTFSNNASTSDLTIATGGTLTAPTQLSLEADYANNGTFSASGGTVYFDGATNDLFAADELRTTSFTDQTTFGFANISFSATGTYFYTTDSDSDEVDQYVLSTPWDLSTASYLHSTSTSAQDGEIESKAVFTPDGTKMFLSGADNDGFYEYDLATAWDVSTAAFAQASTSVLGDPVDLAFNADGTRLIALEGRNLGLYTYTLSTPYDISTLAELETYVDGSHESGMESLVFSADGLTMFIGDDNSGGSPTKEGVFQYTLTEPWVASTSVLERLYEKPGGVEETSGVTLSSDGRYYYVLARLDRSVVTFELAQTATGTMTGTSAFSALTQTNGTELAFGAGASTTGTYTINRPSAATAGATTTAFQAGAEYTFQNIDWAGSSTTEEIVLRSSAFGTEWYLDVPGTQVDVQYVNVQDSNASGGNEIITSSSTDSGNNTNWSFGGDDWNDTDWTLFDTITIKKENIDEPLRDFPVYVDLSDLSTAFWATVLDGGGDIRVTTDEENPVELAREIVSASTASTTGELHFKADYISEVIDTPFRIYYNGVDSDYATDQPYGAETVWSEYYAVYHDGGSTDSTAYGRTATANGSVTEGNIAGRVGLGTEFNGTTQFFESTNVTDIDGSSGVTVSMWIEYDTVIEDDPIYALQTAAYDNSGDGFYQARFDDSLIGSGEEDVIRFGIDYGSNVNIGASAENTATTDWTLLHHVWDSNTNARNQLYINGTEPTPAIAGGIETGSVDADVIAIGRGNKNGYWDGIIDEFRIASTSPSEAWIKAEYINQSTTTDFYFLEAGTGSSTLSDHDAGQVSNAFNFQNKTNESLFVFKLTPESGNATVTELTLALTGAQEIEVGDFSNIRLLRDADNDAVYDATDVQVATGVMTLGNEGHSDDNQQGTIVFSNDFLSTTSQNYLVVADWNSPDSGSSLGVDLQPSGFIMLDTSGGHAVAGSVSYVQHNRNNRGGGGGSAAVGGDAPVGDGDVGGGGSGGGGSAGSGDDGDNIADDPDFLKPSADSGDFDSGENGYESDGVRATNSSGGDRHVYSGFGFTIPGSDTIVGIEVKVDGNYDSTPGSIAVDLSWNNGTNYTSQKSAAASASDTVLTLGSPTDTWGRSWSASEFSDGNLLVRIELTESFMNFDAVQINVYHQASGGGSGGGGGGGAI